MLIFGCSGPEITIHSPIEGELYVTEAYIHIHSTISDPDGVKRVTYKIYGNTYDTYPADVPEIYDLIDTQSMYNFPSGYEVDIIIEAEDNLGNVTAETVTVKHS